MIDILGLSDVQPYETVVDLVLGFDLGILLTGALYSSKYIAKIRAFKMRLLRRDR